MNIGITKGIDLWGLALPVLATVLIAYGIVALNAELKLLSLIRSRYREMQCKSLRIEHNSASCFDFTWRVRCYLGFLFILGVLHVGVTAACWISNACARIRRSVGRRAVRRTSSDGGNAGRICSWRARTRLTRWSLTTEYELFPAGAKVNPQGFPALAAKLQDCVLLGRL